jgi:hypothetical protein
VIAADLRAAERQIEALLILCRMKGQ